jgi:hypothetical protein
MASKDLAPYKRYKKLNEIEKIECLCTANDLSEIKAYLDKMVVV